MLRRETSTARFAPSIMTPSVRDDISLPGSTSEPGLQLHPFSKREGLLLSAIGNQLSAEQPIPALWDGEEAHVEAVG